MDAAQTSEPAAEPTNAPPAAPPAGAAATAPAAPPPFSPIDPHEPVLSIDDPLRARSALPTASEPAPKKRTFAVDPVADGAVILLAGGFAALLDQINSTGEIRPQQISPNFNRSSLLGIDRAAVSQTIDPNASTLSNIGLFVTVSYAGIDPILSALREQNVQTGLTDAMLYLESIAVTWGLTNLAKIAVRRPRPRAYMAAEENRNNPNYSNADTDSSLSFFSGHSSMSAAVSATATYLAFARSPHTARPWITLIVGTALTTFVAIERVRDGAHFPTDVIAGAVAGAGVGVIVPHIHRSEDVAQRRVWVGFAPSAGSGGSVHLTGIF